jgi:hypothetical protein
MTLVSFGGPGAMLLMIKGGPSAKWPPDRAIEWLTIGIVFGLFIMFFLACVSINVWYKAEARSSVRSDVDVDGAQAKPPPLPRSHTRSNTPNEIHRESIGQ